MNVAPDDTDNDSTARHDRPQLAMLRRFLCCDCMSNRLKAAYFTIFRSSLPGLPVTRNFTPYQAPDDQPRPKPFHCPGSGRAIIKFRAGDAADAAVKGTTKPSFVIRELA